MRNNKGKSAISVILSLLILVLIGFLIYEVVYVDIFDIIGKESVIEIDSNILTRTNGISSPEIVQNTYTNQEYTDLTTLYNESSSTSTNKYYYSQLDKYGKITNISTWSPDPNYTPYAIQYIAPVIRSYQGRDFMNFPAGSNRVTTTVSGAWKISDKMTYSSPSDYADVEKIRN